MSSITYSPTRPVSVWIIEDNQQYGSTLCQLLSNTSGIHCKQLFESCEQAITYLEKDADEAAPDVILLDINLPGINGIDGIGAIKTILPTSRIVMLTIMDNAEAIYGAFRAGASGYLLKNTKYDRIIDAVREAYLGGTLMPAEVAGKVLGFFQEKKKTDYKLTRREKEILGKMADGHSQRAIADALFLSPYTVNTHVQHIYEKLHVHSSVQAVAKAFRERLLQ